MAGAGSPGRAAATAAAAAAATTATTAAAASASRRGREVLRAGGLGHAVGGLVPADLPVGRVVPDAAVVVEVDGFRDLRLDLEHRGTVRRGQQPRRLHEAGVQAAGARRAGQAPAAGAAALLPFPPLLALLVLAGGLRARLARAVRVLGAVRRERLAVLQPQVRLALHVALHLDVHGPQRAETVLGCLGVLKIRVLEAVVAVAAVGVTGAVAVIVAIHVVVARVAGLLPVGLRVFAVL